MVFTITFNAFFMTRIDFFSNAPNRLDYVARLLHKVHTAQQTAVVYGDPDTLSALSDALWHNPAFLAHDVQANASLSHSAAIVLISEAMLDFPHHNVLINLSDVTPSFFASFNRLIEVVPNEDAPKQAARERWGFYKSRGYVLNHHDIAAKK